MDSCRQIGLGRIDEKRRSVGGDVAAERVDRDSPADSLWRCHFHVDYPCVQKDGQVVLLLAQDPVRLAESRKIVQSLDAAEFFNDPGLAGVGVVR